MREGSLLEEILGLIRDCHVRSGGLPVARVVHEAVGPLVDNAIGSTGDEELCRRLRALRDSLPAGAPRLRRGRENPRAVTCGRRGCRRG